MKTKMFKKPCKRDKCPYYKMKFDKCSSCEWNPDATWTERKTKMK